MIKVYRQTDRIPLEIAGVTFLIKPLSYGEKMEITKAITTNEGHQLETLLETTRLLMRFTVKDIKGVSYHDGTPLTLSFDDSGALNDDSISELMSLEISQQLNTALSQFANGIPEEIVDGDGRPMDDIKILPIGGAEVKKK